MGKKVPETEEGHPRGHKDEVLRGAINRAGADQPQDVSVALKALLLKLLRTTTPRMISATFALL